MRYDENQIDEIVLALMYLGIHDKGRTWKSFDWESMNRLHQQGFILNPVSNAKSVVLTEDGEQLSKKLFKKYFAIE